ncbi:hypothetical protein M3202_19720 [Alkalihalobacillus oceani]|uniref:Zinc finger CHC2-type domain-containing protein n=1 Tax=Halalkalibacter oceani TaxID=1653776 RepID=A0A9X2DSG9_9BACI|nr:CHC2 zinc finger domain-containing protein [Halalkalibacter oceani]MCM3716276.1 hypothetical protein [Halalkalibacter oceani]
MGLPSIIKVAEEYSVDINPTTLNKKEVLARCPFCQSRQFKLSMNNDKNTFRCWRSSCNESGGVLHFETLLKMNEDNSEYNQTYKKIKSKYFGLKKKNKAHPAEFLTPKQLEVIQWKEAKRESWNYFRKHMGHIFQDWQQHCHLHYRTAFAKLVVGEAIGKYELAIDSIRRQQKEQEITDLLDKTLEVFSTDWLSEPWSVEGLLLARSALRLCVEDKSKENGLLYVIFLSVEQEENIQSNNSEHQQLAGVL